MTRTITDVHQQFASFFQDRDLQPWAWYLSKRLAEGHICVPVNDNSILESGQPFKIQPDAAGLLNCTRYVSTDPEKVLPFIIHNDRLYLHRYFNYETQIVELLSQRFKNSLLKQQAYRDTLNTQKELIQRLVTGLPSRALSPDQKPDWQLLAIIKTMLNDFSIITGGPGTGKTTTLAKLLRVIFTLQPHCRVALAAPTGKASMRMLESLKEKTSDFPAEIVAQIQPLKPFTLHRLLGYKRNSIYFKHNKELPLPYDWVIVDEASMIDVPMFAKLLTACNPETKLLLLGDKDQLASVEAGSLLGDLCIAAGQLNRFSTDEVEWYNTFIPETERQIPADFITDSQSSLVRCITELRYSHRFNQQGEIGQLSLSVINGKAEHADTLLSVGPPAKICRVENNDEAFFSDFVNGYAEYIKEEDIASALNKFNLLRVLVSVREGENGLYAINKKIERILHRKYPKLINPDNGFYINRPVIVTQNNYELGLFNGDIGIVRMNPITNRPTVWFEDTQAESPLRSINPAYLSNCETVFAMTIHKSQGSEFNKVMVVLPDRPDNPLLSRELLYTGITRAKEAVCIRGSAEGLNIGISRQVERISGLQTRLSE